MTMIGSIGIFSVTNSLLQRSRRRMMSPAPPENAVVPRVGPPSAPPGKRFRTTQPTAAQGTVSATAVTPAKASTSGARETTQADRATSVDPAAPVDQDAAIDPDTPVDQDTRERSPNIDRIQLTKEEQEQVAALQKRDREVRSHEQAHLAAAGSLATGPPSFEFETGPDGKQYAVGGEVGLRVPEGRTAEQTLQLAQQARRAALAPSNPSSQDRAVAARATQMATRARVEIAKERAEKRLDEAPSTSLNAPSEGTEGTAGESPNDPARAVRSFGQIGVPAIESILGQIFA